MTSPVLITAFNRPDETRRVLDAIRRYAPTELYITVDGARPDRPGEAAKCAQVVDVLDQVDWDCRVERLVRTENLGCRRAMDGAIDWFFGSVPQGIILEDDCVPSPDFFRFCDELLERFQDDDRVGMVSGTNVLGAWRPTPASYFFGFGAVWGWASWRRAWGRAADHVAGIDSRQARANAERTLGQSRWRMLEPGVRAVAAGTLDTWDYPWVFSLAAHGQVAALPAVNLVSNIGFGLTATHTTVGGGALDQIAVSRLEDPLLHADRIDFDREFDARWQALERTRSSRLARVRGRLPSKVRSIPRSLRRVRDDG
jgi:hypothetical protein